MFGLRSARSRAIATAAVGLLLLAGVATTAAADRAADATLWPLIGLSAAAFALAAATAAGAIVSTVRPLAALRASARAIADGVPEVRAQVSGPEEVASFARDFNAMTDALAAKAQEYIDTTNLTGVTLLRVDKDNRVTFLNDAMCEFLGRSREEILGTPIVEYLHPDDVASTSQAVRQMIKSKQLARGIVSRYVTPMGTRVTEWNGYPIFDEQGRYAGVHGTGRDISECKEAEEALRESEERFRRLSEAAFEAIAIHEKGKIVDANLTYAQMFRYELSEVTGMNVLDFAAPESRDLVWQSILSKCEEPLEAIGLRKDGSTFLGEVCGKAIPYRGRMVTVTAIRDITARKRTEEVLRRREQEVRVIADNVPALFSYIDADGCYRFVNKRYEELFGIPPTQIIGKHLREFLGEAAYGRIRDHVDTVLSGRPVRYEEALPYRHGGTRWVVADLVPDVDDQGKVKGFFALVTDISERKRAGEALRESEEKYRLLAENVTDVIWTMDTDLHFTYVSPSVTRLRGYTVEEAMGQTVKQMLTPASLEVVKKVIAAEQVREQMEQKDLARSLTLEVEQTCKDGSTVWTEVTLTYLRDSSGRPSDILGITRDISERKRAEDALRESEDRHRAMFEQAADSIALIDAETGALVQFNDRAHQALGYTREEFERLKVSDFEVIESAEDIAKHVERILREGADVFETKHRTKSGEIRDIQVSSRAVTLGGRHFTQGIWRDVTERKRVEHALRESEEKYRRLMQDSIDGRAVAEGMEITLVNRAFLEMFGYESEEEVVGHPFTNLVSPEYREIMVERGYAREKGEDVLARYEFKALRKDGSEFDADISVSGIAYKGRLKRQAVIKDISERKRAEEALRTKDSAIESAINGIALADPEGNLTYVNPFLLRMWGYDHDSEMLGRHVTEFWQAKEKAYAVGRALRDRGSWIGELVALKKDGSTFDAQLSATTVTDAAGKLICIMGSFHDITERKRAEEALRESEEKFRNIFQSASDAIMYLDTSGRILDVNEKAVEVFGGPKEELLGKHFATIGVFNLRDIKPLMTSFASILGGEKASVEIRIKNRKGQERFLDCTGSSLKVDGRTPGMVVVAARDITERKQAEEALRAAREDIESRVERRMQAVDGYGLTFRELTILHLVAAGESDKEIATVLGISPLTAHKHLANILEKMGAASRTEAGVRALREGLLD